MVEGAGPIPGSVLSRYRLEERLGSAPSCQLFRARDLELGRLVEIELLEPERLTDAESRSAFERAARSLAGVEHPSLVRLLEAGEEKGVPFLVWEHVSGESLADRLDAGPLPPDEVVRLGAELASALEAVHAAGVAVPDLAPERIRFGRDGRLKLVPAGGPRLLLPPPSRSTVDAWADTAMVRSDAARAEPPEEIRTAIREAGGVLYQMATGQRPPPPSDATPAPPSVPPSGRLSGGVSDLLDSVILKALAHDSDSHYSSAAELASDLERARSEAISTSAARRVLRRRWLWGVAVLALGGAGVLVSSLFWGSAHHLDSIAVLPLRNATGDPHLEYLADGVTEDLILRLSHLAQLKVIARSSVFRYKGRAVDPRAVGRELGVEAVLVGSIRRVGARLRIAAELVAPGDGRLLLGLRHEARADDLGALQAEFVDEVVRALRPRLAVGQRRRLSDPGAASPEARRLVLRGRQLLHRHDREALEEAISLFEQARIRAPDFAAAHVGLAQAYYELSNVYIAPRRAMPRALRAARRALELDPRSGPAYIILGAVQAFYERRWAEAGRSFRRALELSPALADAHQYYGIYLFLLGHYRDAQRALQRARELDPLSVGIALRAILPAYYARRYAEALRGARRVIAVQPDHAASHYFLAKVLSAAGRWREALEALHKAQRLGDTPSTRASIAQVLAASGQRQRARALIDRIRSAPAHQRVASYHLALAYGYLGDLDEAFRWLDRAERERSESLLQLAVDPHADPLRKDPRYAALVARLGLKPPPPGR